jgi:hypothetical protein
MGQVILKNLRLNILWKKLIMSAKEGRLRKAKTQEVNAQKMLKLCTLE